MIKIHPNLINFVKPDAHSKYGPSYADRWITCAYSTKASEGIILPESSYAAEGTLAHSVGEAVFRQKELGINIPVALTFEMLGIKDNGDEMMEAANAYYEVTDYWVKNKDLIGDVLWFGQERGIPVFPELGCYGTGDFIIVGSKASVVIDFKYGRKMVKADSKQLKTYAAGIARHLDNVPRGYKIYCIIFQPRVSHEVREHSYTINELYDFLGVIKTAITKAERTDNEPVEGSHCFWCPARRTTDLKKRCELIKNKPLKLAQENFAKFMADSSLCPDTVDKKVARDEAIIKLMTLLPAIEEVVSQSREDFKTRIELGEAIPGINIINKMGKRELNALNDTDAAKMIRDMFPMVNPMRTVTKTSVRTLTDLEKEVGKGKLDPICKKKITKEVVVLDEKAQSILNSMSQFAINISKS